MCVREEERKTCVRILYTGVIVERAFARVLDGDLFLQVLDAQYIGFFVFVVFKLLHVQFLSLGREEEDGFDEEAEGNNDGEEVDEADEDGCEKEDEQQEELQELEEEEAEEEELLHDEEEEEEEDDEEEEQEGEYEEDNEEEEEEEFKFESSGSSIVTLSSFVDFLFLYTR